jgi:hypothetical protein
LTLLHHQNAIAQVLLSQVAQSGIAHSGGHRLACQGNIFGELLGGEAQAHRAGDAQHELFGNQLANQHRPHQGDRFLYLFALAGVQLIELLGGEPELGTDLRQQPRQQGGIHRPVQPRHRNGAGRCRHQRAPVQQAAAALHGRSQLGVVSSHLLGRCHEACLACGG